MSEPARAAEQELLGSVLNGVVSWSDVSAIVRPEHFAGSDERAIAATVASMAADGEPVDIVSVAVRMPTLPDGESSLPLLTHWAENAHGLNTARHASIVREHAARRGLMAFGSRVAELAGQPHADTTALLDAARNLLDRIDLPSGAEVLPELASCDAREPLPVLWRDNGGRYADAVLSIGEVAILASAGGAGKSTLTLELALAAVQAPPADTPGGGWRAACGLRVRGGPVVLVSYEDSPARLRGRVLRMNNGQVPSGLRYFPEPGPLFVGTDRGTVGPAPDWPRLWHAVREHNPSIVIVDPTSAALAGVNSNDSAPVRAFMRALALEAERSQCGILLVAHDNKQARVSAGAGNDPGPGAVAGSATWFDAARAVLSLTRPDADGTDRELRCLKANYGVTGWRVRLRERTSAGGRFVGFESAPEPSAAARARYGEVTEHDV